MKNFNLHSLKLGESKVVRPSEFATRVKPKATVIIKLDNGYETEMIYESNIDKKVFIFKAKI